MSRAVCVALVDPYTSGKVYVDAFARLGASCVRVDSGRQVPESFRDGFAGGTYFQELNHRGDFDETVARLRELGVGQVLAGSELGVYLSDRLCALMGLPGNGTALSAARREKDLMAAAVAATGAAPAGIASNRIRPLLDWAQARNRWPVVFKPTAATASEGVTLCSDANQLEQAFICQKGRPNIMGLINERFLVQEFLEGEEYVVDTVSCRGQHRLAAFWRYLKPRGGAEFLGYEGIELMPREGARATALIDMAERVLDALAIRFGPVHQELIWHEGRPRLIEMGARPHGGENPRYAGWCLGYNQLELSARAYLQPERFLAARTNYRLQKQATILFLRPLQSGILRGLGDLDPIRKLASCVDLHCAPILGEPVPTIAGVVSLVHPSKQVVVSDVAAIRHYEAQGLYQIEGGSGS